MKSGRIGMRVDAARADLAHQVHAHRVAAEREERAVAERENAAIAPDQVDRERQQRVADVFAAQRHEVASSTCNGERRRQQQIEQRHEHGDGRSTREEPAPRPCRARGIRGEARASIMPPPPGP